MAIETRILASIPHHPNIIKLRAVVKNGKDDNTTNNNDSTPIFPSCCFHENYCLVLDRLYGTLEERWIDWKQQSNPYRRTQTQRRRRGLGRLFCQKRGGDNDNDNDNDNDIDNDSNNDDSEAAALGKTQRLSACLELASGLTHLHKHRILHRDIKPNNVGFNVRGDLVLFDFGLSRNLPPSVSNQNQHSDDTNTANDAVFHMTGFCGSPRYMAPEVGKRLKYNSKCDVYSFGVLAWQILSLQKPFEGCTVEDLLDDVWPFALSGVAYGPGDWLMMHDKGNGKSKKRSKHSKTKPKSRRKNINRNANDKSKSKSKSKANSMDTDIDPMVARMIDRTFSGNSALRPTMQELEYALRRECIRNHQKECCEDSNRDSCIGPQSQIQQSSPYLTSSRRRSTFIFRYNERKSQQKKLQQQQQQKLQTKRRSSRNHLERSRGEDNTYHGADTEQSSISSISSKGSMYDESSLLSRFMKALR